MAAYETKCMMTRVKNPTEKTLTYTFLGHTRPFHAGEERIFRGDIYAQVAASAFGRPNQRRLQAFVHALRVGNIQILSLPNPILMDTSSGETKMLTIAAGVVTASAPCFSVTDTDSESDSV